MEVYKDANLYRYIQVLCSELEEKYVNGTFFGSLINEFAMNEIFLLNRSRLVSNEHSVHWIYPLWTGVDSGSLEQMQSRECSIERIFKDLSMKLDKYDISLECSQRSSSFVILTVAVNTNILHDGSLIYWSLYVYLNLGHIDATDLNEICGDGQDIYTYHTLQNFMYGNTFLIRTNRQFYEWNFKEKRKIPLSNNIDPLEFADKICTRLPQSEIQVGLFDNYRELFGFTFFRKVIFVFSQLSKTLMGQNSIYFNPTDCADAMIECNICCTNCSEKLVQTKCCKQHLCCNCIFRIFLQTVGDGKSVAPCPYCRNSWHIIE